MTEKSLKKDKDKEKQLSKPAPEEKEFPEFPEEEEKGSSTKSSPLGSDSEEEEVEADEFLQEVCEDIVGAGFEVWGLANPNIEELKKAEKVRISKPLSRMVVKYNVAKYMKDEFLFCTFLGYAVMKRLKKGDHVNNHSREERKREDDTNQELNQE